jgi:hypothetical protein
VPLATIAIIQLDPAHDHTAWEGVEVHVAMPVLFPEIFAQLLG